MALVCSAGAVAVASARTAATNWHATGWQWAEFALTAVLAAASVIAARRTARGLGPPAVFLVAGAIVLPFGFAPFLPVLACAVAAVRARPRLLVSLERLFTASLAATAASAVAHAGSSAALAVGAAVAFGACALGPEAASALRRARPVLTSRLADDAVLVLLGAALALLWTADPWTAPLALLPMVFYHRLQRLPALEQQALTDAKTGLMNMHVFDGALHAALARAHADRRPLSLVVIDLDLLREINNAHGHLAGDAVIRGISDVLRQQIRKGDLAARFGGEEFMLALPDTPPDRAVRIAERIREAVASRVFRVEPAGPAARATLSAGVSAYPRDARTARALVQAADLAAMAAKARGRNRVVDSADLALPRSPARRPQDRPFGPLSSVARGR
jgi:diguanylate cyclase (GGDEF)-like protein